MMAAPGLGDIGKAAAEGIGKMNPMNSDMGLAPAKARRSKSARPVSTRSISSPRCRTAQSGCYFICVAGEVAISCTHWSRRRERSHVVIPVHSGAGDPCGGARPECTRGADRNAAQPSNDGRDREPVTAQDQPELQGRPRRGNPESARNAGEHGEVRLSAIIGTDGKLADQFVFDPAKDTAGNAIAVPATVPVQFSNLQSTRKDRAILGCSCAQFVCNLNSCAIRIGGRRPGARSATNSARWRCSRRRRSPREILVERVKLLRNAEAEGRFDDALAAITALAKGH